MDLQMPYMDGIEATRQIRRIEGEKIKKVAIIGLTADANRAVHQKCIEAGMNEILVKPFEASRLYAVIERNLVSNSSF
jgi:CheY-like chemotaxis protein